MAVYQLQNNQLTLEFNSLGAELTRVTGADGTEYLWNADPAYWKRHSPILFPVVGNYNHKEFIYNGRKYSMGQHGFARDMEFECVSQTEEEICFRLVSDEASRKLYPMDFVLEAAYRLCNNQVTVCWNVTNPGADALHFSIGAHPAFNCPILPDTCQNEYTIDLHTDIQELICGLINEEGALTHKQSVQALNSGKLTLKEHLFDKDALIVEHTDIKKLSICLPDGRPYVIMDFTAPLFGLWSPAGKNAPFVCLEPWYGRCDRTDFKGSISEREYGHTLKKGETFEASYSMQFLPIQ